MLLKPMFTFAVLKILLFGLTVIHLKFETNSSFHMKKYKIGKIKFLFFRTVLP